ncbi:hypothetical protein [Pelagibacterium montanilacus]|uniref:hypothetical protein n=1 Tax=Pelagibacterium montanilacus TaxID=2185280 RepID=UPI000F8F7F02|nr:hypothetical protein [Pelagibacterium montanilacus]
MIKQISVVVVLAGSLALAGCTTTERAMTGAAIGGAGGAVVGNAIAGPVGGAVGAAGGAATGVFVADNMR